MCGPQASIPRGERCAWKRGLRRRLRTVAMTRRRGRGARRHCAGECFGLRHGMPHARGRAIGSGLYRRGEKDDQGSGCVHRAVGVSGGMALRPGRAVSVRAAEGGCAAKLRRAERGDACGRRAFRWYPRRYAEVAGPAWEGARARKLRRQPLIPYSERSQRPLVSVLPAKVRQTKVFWNVIITKMFWKPTRAGV